MYGFSNLIEKEIEMEILTAISTVSVVGLGLFNFYLASTSSSESVTSSDAINWLAGLLSVGYGAVIVAMWKHMTNDEKHINKNVNTLKLVTNDQCEKTHTSVVEKLEELKEELVQRDKAAEKSFMKEIRYTKLLMQTLLLRAGMESKDIKELEEDDDE